MAGIEANHRSEPPKFAYAPFSSYLLGCLKEKTALSAIIAEYEKNGVKLTRRAYQKAARRLEREGRIQLRRFEQLYAFPADVKRTDEKEEEKGAFDVRPMNSANMGIEANHVHSTHRILLSMPYSGQQPREGGEERRFGRYGTALQVVFRQGDFTINAFRKRLNIWVHKPQGARTQEQLLEAKVMGYRALRSFAQAHNIVLEGYLEKILFSHHVVESDALNEALKPLFKLYGEDIQARIGSKICPTSHPGKIEHEGKARPDRIVRGDQVAKGLEYLTLDFQNSFEQFKDEALKPLTEQLKLHLTVEQRTLEALDAIKAHFDNQAAIKEKDKKFE